MNPQLVLWYARIASRAPERAEHLKHKVSTQIGWRIPQPVGESQRRPRKLAEVVGARYLNPAEFFGSRQTLETKAAWSLGHRVRGTESNSFGGIQNMPYKRA